MRHPYPLYNAVATALAPAVFEPTDYPNGIGRKARITLGENDAT